MEDEKEEEGEEEEEEGGEKKGGVEGVEGGGEGGEGGRGEGRIGEGGRVGGGIGEREETSVKEKGDERGGSRSTKKVNSISRYEHLVCLHTCHFVHFVSSSGCVCLENRPCKDGSILEGLVQWPHKAFSLLPYSKDTHLSRYGKHTLLTTSAHTPT